MLAKTKTEGLLQTIFFFKKILLIMSVINRIPYVLMVILYLCVKIFLQKLIKYRHGLFHYTCAVHVFNWSTLKIINCPNSIYRLRKRNQVSFLVFCREKKFVEILYGNAGGKCCVFYFYLSIKIFFVFSINNLSENSVLFFYVFVLMSASCCSYLLFLIIF